MKILSPLPLLTRGAVILTAGLFSLTAQAAVTQESRSLDNIYQSALKEGGAVTVYAGGDTP